jgi:hypothetical protein
VAQMHRQPLGIPHKKKGGHIQGRHGNHYDPTRTKRGLLSGKQRTVLLQTSGRTAARQLSCGDPCVDVLLAWMLPVST